MYGLWGRRLSERDRTAAAAGRASGSGGSSRPASSPEACAAASRSRAESSTRRASSFSTSRRRGSTRRAAARSGTCSTTCASATRSLAIILTTHAMEEADYLCDRIAILDQGKVLCEDTPAGPEARPRIGRAGRARDRPRRSRRADREARRRGRRGAAPGSCRGPRPLHGEAGRGHGPQDRAPPRGPRVPHRPSDDRPRDPRGRLLLLHGTGAAGGMSPARKGKDRPPARGLGLALLGMAAIGQRAFLTLWRQPVLVVSTMLFPVVYLVILGNAMNRPLERLPLAVVDEAGNAYSAECRRGVLALETGRGLVQATFLDGPRGGARRPAPRPLPRRVGAAVRSVAARARAVVHRRQHGPLLLRRARVRARADLAGGRGAEERAPLGAAGAARGLSRTSTT